MPDSPFRSLFEINMGIRPGERILVFSDTIRPDERPSPADRDRRERLLAMARETAEFAERAYGACRFVSFPATAASGAEPPEPLWRAALGGVTVDRLIAAGLLVRLLAKSTTAEEFADARAIVSASPEAAQVIVALANNSTSHTRFRTLMNAVGCRFASLPHFDPEMLQTSMMVDWLSLAERTRKLAGIITAATRVTLTTPAGTSLSLGVSGRTAKSDDGLLTEPGSFGNLPAGEAFLAPVEGTTEGDLVIEYAPTRKLASPLRLRVRQGKVIAIEGDDPYRARLEGKFAESDYNRNIAELGIGTNDRATRPDNVLEAEKILGTVHIALGDNAGFGGTVSTPFHEDYVLYQPNLVAEMTDGQCVTVLDNGRLLV
jgi:leucyl aminopeptidase (aminopeptidase T)